MSEDVADPLHQGSSAAVEGETSPVREPLVRPRVDEDEWADERGGGSQGGARGALLQSLGALLSQVTPPLARPLPSHLPVSLV